RRRIDSSKPTCRQNRCCKNGSDHRFRFLRRPQMESASLADGVRNEIESFSGMHRIYLTGGGAEIIYSYIKEYFPRHKVSKVEEPQFALVKAMVRA
ncbi:hypothetical protein FOT80_16985, partial [Serratia fonticola]|nr:hypothetical protein [Serratia fonticola]